MTIRRSDIVFFFALLLGLYIAWMVRDILLLIYISALFAVVVTPAVDLVRQIRIGKWRPSRGLAILVIVALGVGLLVVFLAFALPPIFSDLHALATDWPRRSNELMQRLHRVPLLDRLDISALQSQFAAAAGGLVGLFKQVAGGVFWFFSWLILTAYFIAEGDRAFHWIMSLFPAHQRDRLEPTLLRAEARLRRWLLGQGTLMLVLGSASAVAFALLQIKYFYALAVFAGVANIVPIVGPLTSLALASLVAISDSGMKLVGVLVFYFVYQQIENAFLTPRIMRTTLDLPPLAVIISLSIGGALAGILGALVAVPTAAVVAVFAEEYLVKPHRADAGEATTDTANKFGVVRSE